MNSQTGLASAYIRDLTPASYYEAGYYNYPNAVYPLNGTIVRPENSPQSCAMLEITLEEIGEIQTQTMSFTVEKARLSSEFDDYDEDCRFGEKTFEKAESRLQTNTARLAIKKSGFCEKDIDCIFAGDLLNQCIGSAFGLRDIGIPYVGLYGACSTMALGISMASIMLDSGAAKRAIALTSSHFCSAERQYRFPLELGNQRPPTAQWTITGGGASVISNTRSRVKISAVLKC